MNYRFIADNYKEALDQYISGIAEHATFIKHEQITPDIAVTCFRTSAQGNQFYFCLLEYDYLHTIKYAKKVISASFAKVIEFIPPIENQKGRTELAKKSVGQQGEFLLLARTERPKGKGYWASNIVLMPGDEIAPKIAHLSDEDKLGFLNTYINVASSDPSPGAQTEPTNFLSGWQHIAQKRQLKPEEVTINDTRLAISIYKNLSGGWDSFHNYVR